MSFHLLQFEFAASDLRCVERCRFIFTEHAGRTPQASGRLPQLRRCFGKTTLAPIPGP